MNHLPALESLKNTYIAMRHGESLANEAGIIVSNPTNGMKGNGLSEKGKQEVRISAQRASKEKLLDMNTIIFSSDFTRTNETANIVSDILGAGDVILTPKLRERFFGLWDGTKDSNYQKVWTNDARDTAYAPNGVESIDDVLNRTTSLIEILECTYFNNTILLVSHSDTLQILQTAFTRTKSATHRSLTSFHTSEIRVIHFHTI